jgi:hypothetical protein
LVNQTPLLSNPVKVLAKEKHKVPLATTQVVGDMARLSIEA